LQHLHVDVADGDPDVSEIVAPVLFAFADLKDVPLFAQVSKGWRADLKVAEKYIYLNLVRKYGSALALFTDRFSMMSVPANTQPSTHWKEIFRLPYEIMKASYVNSDERFCLETIDASSIPPPVQANKYVIVQDGQRQSFTHGYVAPRVTDDGTFVFRNLLSFKKTASFEMFKGTKMPPRD